MLFFQCFEHYSCLEVNVNEALGTDVQSPMAGDVSGQQTGLQTYQFRAGDHGQVVKCVVLADVHNSQSLYLYMISQTSVFVFVDIPSHWLKAAIKKCQTAFLGGGKL